jgi:hypothetical protein
MGVTLAPTERAPSSRSRAATPAPLSRAVRVVGHSFVDGRGPFLGLGVSYFSALWKFRNDRPRFESDMAFLSKQGFNYYRMFSMVGFNAAWEGREIPPVSFTSKSGKRVEAWADYDKQFRQMIDLAFDRYGMRTQITIFADAQLMPEKSARLAHIDRLLREVVRGREEKILLIEVANEAWQNGFPGEQGNDDLREFASFLNLRTDVPVAISSNHDRAFKTVYAGSRADLATWHFSRDKGQDDGWKPVYDCWEFGDMPGYPPVVSNEPIGPGSSVSSENEPIKLVMAAAFAYTAKLPAYLFHSRAGVMGKVRFEEMAGIDRFRHLRRLLPPDLPNWRRNNGKEPAAPFTALSDGQPNRYWPEVEKATDGCVRNIGARKGDRFVCVPIGVRPAGLELEARENLRCKVYNPLTGKALFSGRWRKGEKRRMPGEPGGLIIVGNTLRD